MTQSTDGRWTDRRESVSFCLNLLCLTYHPIMCEYDATSLALRRQVVRVHSSVIAIKLNTKNRGEETSSHCGRCCREGRDPPHRPPHTGPGAGGAHLDTRSTGIPRVPSRRRRSCGRLRRKRRESIDKLVEEGEKSSVVR